MGRAHESEVGGRNGKQGIAYVGAKPRTAGNRHAEMGGRSLVFLVVADLVQRPLTKPTETRAGAAGQCPGA